MSDRVPRQKGNRLDFGGDFLVPLRGLAISIAKGAQRNSRTAGDAPDVIRHPEETMNVSEQQTKNLPVAVDDDFIGDDNDGRLIQGTIARCVDGHWKSRDGTSLPPEARFLVLGTTQAVQCWRDGMPVDTIVKTPNERLPKVADLNAKIPEKEWEKGLDGKPRPPWVLQHIVYLLDVADASVFTFINSTVGAAIAVDRLRDRVRYMRTLRGDHVRPIVKLDARPMTTRFGQKMRPEFTILEWRDLGDGQPPQPLKDPVKQIGASVKPETWEEILNDELPEGL